MGWQLNGVNLLYGPSYQDDMDLEKKESIEATLPSKTMQNIHLFLKDYENIKSLIWDRATAALKQQIVSIPLFTNIPFYDNITQTAYTVQILERKIFPLRTYKGGEILWSISLKIRIIS